jgi:septum formation protein
MPSRTAPLLILASSSPRRIDLLTQAGLPPVVLAPGADETEIPGESPRAMVARLARDKAEAVAARVLAGRAPGVKPGTSVVIVAADTTVVAPGGRKILGKPRDARDARRMLSTLSGREHTVLTGYCVLRLDGGGRASVSKAKKKAPTTRAFRSHVLGRVVVSRVRMRKLSARDIAQYVATGEPMDKAGSYAAQGIGMALIESIRGSYANVVGLPICQLAQDLETSFGMGLFSAGRKRGR